MVKARSGESPGGVDKEWPPVGLRISMGRKAKEMSQGDLAKSIGVTTAYVSKLESGNAPPSDKLSVKIARVLDLDEEESRAFRAAALHKRTGVRVEDICPHVVPRGARKELEPYEREILHALRTLDEPSRQHVIDLILWAQERSSKRKGRTGRNEPQ